MTKERGGKKEMEVGVGKAEGIERGNGKIRGDLEKEFVRKQGE